MLTRDAPRTEATPREPSVRGCGAGGRSRGAREGGGTTRRCRRHGQGGSCKLPGPGLHVGRARDLEDVLGDVAQVFDGRRRAAGHPDDSGCGEDLRIGEVTDPLDLDGRRAGDLAQPGQLLGIGARSAAHDHHEVDVLGRLHRVLLATDRDRTDRVDDLELVGTPDHERGELLELPGRLGRLADERHPLLARDGRLPFLFLVHDDRIRREAEHADDLGVLGGTEQDDRVALLDELRQLAVLLDDPGAGAVDDLEAARVGPIHDVRAHAVGPDDDRRSVVDIVEGLDRLDTQILQVADDALVVDDLAEGMRRLAGGRGLLGLVDRFSYAITEPGALRDPDFLNDSHVSIIARGPVQPP